MAEESRMTFKAGVIVSLIASITVFVLSTLWVHQTDITLLKTNQVHVMSVISEMRSIPSQLAAIQTELDGISKAQDIHYGISAQNYKILRKARDGK